MATYDPPQPLWKRNVAGVLDFLLAFIVLGIAVNKVFPAPPHALPKFGNATTVELFNLNGWPALVVIGLVVAYFVVLGRTGGTVFQRAFGMKRATRAPGQ
jgi:hypothetical protein